MKLDQASLEALLKTLFASAEKLSNERRKWSGLSTIERAVIIVMIAAFVISAIYYVATHQIFPLLITVGICCIVAFAGINGTLSALDSLLKESNEYQISVNVLLECINAQWNHDDLQLLVGAGIACAREHCNTSAFPVETWTIAQLSEIDEFGNYLVVANRITNIARVLEKVESEASDVKDLMDKLAAGQETAQLNSDVNKLISDSISLLTEHGLYHPDMSPLDAIGKASELLKEIRVNGDTITTPTVPTEAHIISKNPGEDLDVKA